MLQGNYYSIVKKNEEKVKLQNGVCMNGAVLWQDNLNILKSGRLIGGFDFGYF